MPRSAGDAMDMGLDVKNSIANSSDLNG